MRKLMKPLSMLLSIIMILSVFTIIPVGAAEARIDTSELSLAAEDQPVVSLDRSSDLASTGADLDMAETGHYNITVGRVVVKEDNYNDVLGDGTVSYNPNTKVLTLREPRLYETYSGNPKFGAIHIQQDGVTVRGSYHMTNAISYYGLKVTDGNSVTLEGDFVFRGTQCGVVAGIGSKVTVNSGTLKAISSNKFEHSAGVYCDDFVINSGITSVEMQCASCAFEGDKLTLNGVRPTTDDFFFPQSRAIVNADVSNLASRVVIKPWSGTYYDLWLGSRHVDSGNYSDIYGDGTASYDPANKTLTLNDPDIRGAYLGGEVLAVNYKIYSGSDLTVKGSYKMTSDQLILSPDITPDNDDDGNLYLRAGVYSKTNLTLDGDFAFVAKKFPVSAENNVTISSGTVKASGSDNLGIAALNGALTVKGAVTKIDAEAEIYPLRGQTALNIEDGVHISIPRNGSVAALPSGAYVVMDPANSSTPNHVVIESGTVETYGLYLAQTEVTSLNCDDIFGDGTASYSPSTHTLILHDPVISGTALNNSITYKIIGSDDLTIKGSYHMSSADCDIGVRIIKGTLTFDGDFTFMGTKYAAYSDGGVTIRSGTLTAVGGGYAAVAAMGGELYIGGDITKVDMQGTNFPCLAKKISLIGVEVTNPSQYAVIDLQDLGYYTIGAATGTVPRCVVESNSGEFYNIVLGSKAVTSSNKDDIFKDGGSAVYDPDTKTLTLNNPTIYGAYKNGSNTFKIFSLGALNIEGNYAMDEADATIGLFSNANLTINGDFTFKGTAYGVYAASGVTVDSGSLTAEGGKMGVITNGPVALGGGVVTLDATGGTYAFIGDSVTLADELIVTEPSGGRIGSVSGYDGVVDASGSGAKHAVIERKIEPAEEPTEEPTEAPTEAPTAAPTEAPTAAPTEAPTAAPTTAPTTAPTEEPPVSTVKYYIVGGFTEWQTKDEYALNKNNAAQGEEYLFTGLSLKSGDEFKVVKVENGEQTWFPAGTDNNYGVTADGKYNVYFRPNYDGGDSWFYGTIYAATPSTGVGLEGEGTEESPYLIKTSEDWNALGAYFAAGSSVKGKYYKLTDDITVTKGIGSSENPFKGVFDGGGHTLTFNATSAGGATAPFVYASNATFIHLHTAGTINTSSMFSSGLIGESSSGVTITDCRSSVTIVSSIDGDGSHGGFIGRQIDGNVTFRGCLFDGKLLGEKTNRCGGFVGWRSQTMTVYDSVFAPAQITVSKSGSATFARNKVESHNSYFTYLLNDGNEFVPYPGGDNNGQQAYTITAIEGVTLSFGDPADDGVYEVSGITSYGTGLTYNGAFYAKVGETFAITAEPEDKNYVASAGKLTQDGGTLTLVIPASDVVIAIVEIGLEGEGTEEAPFLIATSEDWDAFTAYVIAGGFTKGQHFKLADDITAKTAVSANAFSGIFDGDGHTLTLDKLSGSPFGNISGATIKNLKVDGSVSGGRHISALVSGCNGTAENLIENVVVSADIATDDTYCGGFVGHGGGTAKTTLRNCVFAGTFSQGVTIGTFWGWSDGGSTPVLENCLDMSATNHPIGRGAPSGTVTNCYYTNASKMTDGGRPWTNGGKRAYTVTGDGIELTLNGAPGLVYDGLIYAGEGEVVSLKANPQNMLCTASAGTLNQNLSALSLTMPASNVTVKATGESYGAYSGIISASSGYDGEGADKLFDGKTGTKWCADTEDGTPTVTFATKTKIVPKRYMLATANDTAGNSGRNPVSWTLEASADGSKWVTLADVSNDNTLKAANETYYNFSLTNPTEEAYLLYRFTVKKISSGNTFQLSELQLYGTDNGETAEDIKYDIWLGSTQVTFANRNDILGDGGRAKYDPFSNTLTLNEPTIEGEHVFGTNHVSCKIYSYVQDLTVRGSYHMTEADTDRGIQLHGSPVLDGNFTFMGKEYGVVARSDLKFRSGYVKAFCPNNDISSAAIDVNGIIVLEDGFGGLYAEGGATPIRIMLNSSVYTLRDHVRMTIPEGGYFDHDPSGSSAQFVFNADGTVADRVLIESIRDYDLWLGSTRVNTNNKDDIFGDGKASFDPFTNTLTMDNPSIAGYQHSGSSSIKILSYTDLHMVGSYIMEGADANINLQVNGNLTLNGEFVLRSWGYCIYSGGNLVIEDGSLLAAANWDYGISANRITIKEGVSRVEVTCNVYEALRYNSMTLEGKITLTSPKGAYVGGNSVYESNGSKSHSAVLEPIKVITFDVQDHGEAPETLTINLYDKIPQPDDPVEEGYDFLGWYTDEEYTDKFDFSADVKDDMTLYAKWARSVYTVSFVENGHGETPETQKIVHGSTAVRPDDPVDPGYALIGWYSDEEFKHEYDFTAEVTSDMTLYAKWEAVGYTVTVVADNGTAAQYVEGKSFNYGDEYTLPECIFAVPDGKAFDGWDKGKPGDKLTITANTTVTAVWRKIFIVGDVDGNDMVNNRDAVILDRYIADWDGYDKRITNMKAADLNQDGKVNNRDAMILDRYIACWDGYEKYVVKV